MLDWANHSTGYTYFADGLLNTINNADSTTAQFSYDNARRISQVLNRTSSSAIISRHSYTLDAVDNRTGLGETLAQVGGGSPLQQSLSYGYDNLYRLTSAGNGATATPISTPTPTVVSTATPTPTATLTPVPPTAPTSDGYADTRPSNRHADHYEHPHRDEYTDAELHDAGGRH